MAKDYEAAICGNCPIRPYDPDTGLPVKDGLRIGERHFENQLAAVVYSVEDPRINASYRFFDGVDASTVVREAHGCTPLVEGMTSQLGQTSFDVQLSRRALERDAPVACKLTLLLFSDSGLPDDLLYQKNN